MAEIWAILNVEKSKKDYACGWEERERERERKRENVGLFET